MAESSEATKEHCPLQVIPKVISINNSYLMLHPADTWRESAILLKHTILVHS